jgi:hypothetical protein
MLLTRTTRQKRGQRPRRKIWPTKKTRIHSSASAQRFLARSTPWCSQRPHQPLLGEVAEARAEARVLVVVAAEAAAGAAAGAAAEEA